MSFPEINSLKPFQDELGIITYSFSKAQCHDLAMQIIEISSTFFTEGVEKDLFTLRQNLLEVANRAAESGRNGIAANLEKTINKFLPEDKEKDKANSEEKVHLGECIICMDAPVKAVAIPCGHLHYCLECIKKIEVCSSCDAKITSRVQVYTL